MPKFLIIRFSSIGDIVLTTPVIRCLKKQVKDAEVHFLTKTSFREIIEHNPYIDKKIYFENDLDATVKQLKSENYNYIIDLHHNLRTFIIKLRLMKRSYAFSKINFQKWLIVNFKINTLPQKHIVDRYFETVKSFEVENDGAGLDYFIIPEDEKIIQQLPPSHQQGYIGFVIGAKHNTKKLPVEKIISICSKINFPVILIGGKEDYQIAENIIASSPTSIFNACGKFSVNQSAAIVKYAHTIITHDTGFMHIAAAFKKRIISVWGNTIPEFGMYPYNTEESKIAEVENLYCRPCSKIGFDKCPKVHFRCMREIDEGEIIKAIG
ncbi:MAG TPA: glycosyltransferase family 9 protein [Bacteroidia bacterium]|nr:glycosyltransferase family 9 protein [Bacteroidia bacterium]